MNKFGTFVCGGIVGAIGALLLAPRSGEETRTLMADQANNIASTAQVKSGDIKDKVQQGVRSAGTKGADVVSNVKDATNKTAPDFTDKNEELRAKIDAARARIAEQVKQNASESAQAASTYSAVAGVENTPSTPNESDADIQE